MLGRLHTYPLQSVKKKHVWGQHKWQAILQLFDIFCMCWYPEAPYLSCNFFDPKSCDAQTVPLEFKLMAMRWEAAEVGSSGAYQQLQRRICRSCPPFLRHIMRYNDIMSKKNISSFSTKLWWFSGAGTSAQTPLYRLRLVCYGLHKIAFFFAVVSFTRLWWFCGAGTCTSSFFVRRWTPPP